MADNTIITSVLADIFNKYGTDNVFEFVQSYSDDPTSALNSNFVNKSLANKLKTVKMPQLDIITCKNMESIIKKRSIFRKNIRGESIGGLG